MPLYDFDMSKWLCYAQFVLGWFILIIWGQRLICHRECLTRMQLPSSKLLFPIFGLILAFSTRGRSLCIFWPTECGFRVVSSHFWAPRVSKFTRWSSAWPVVLTGLTGVSVRSCAMLRTVLIDQSKAGVVALFVKRFACIHPGELHWFKGSLQVCRGSSLWFSSFALVVCALFLRLFCLGCVKSLPLLKGTKTFLSQVICAHCL
jgi:hypothetical protein